MSPLPGWIKINTDGVANSTLSALSGGGVFRNFRGFVQHAFMLSWDKGSLFQVEIIAIIYVLELPQSRDLNAVWLEVYSIYVIALLHMQGQLSCRGVLRRSGVAFCLTLLAYDF